MHHVVMVVVIHLGPCCRGKQSDQCQHDNATTHGPKPQEAAPIVATLLAPMAIGEATPTQFQAQSLSPQREPPEQTKLSLRIPLRDSSWCCALERKHQPVALSLTGSKRAREN